MATEQTAPPPEPAGPDDDREVVRRHDALGYRCPTCRPDGWCDRAWWAELDVAREGLPWPHW